EDELVGLDTRAGAGGLGHELYLTACGDHPRAELEGAGDSRGHSPQPVGRSATDCVDLHRALVIVGHIHGDGRRLRLQLSWVRRAPRHPAPGVRCATLRAGSATAQAVVRVASPDGRNQVTFQIKDGRAYYDLQRDGRALILPSLLGFEFKGAPPLRDSLRIT